jgi:outer membrane protein, multidrug efflux system
MRKAILLSAMSLFLYGCPPRTQYVRPELPVPAGWPGGVNGQPAATAASPAITVKWKDYFAESQLQSLIGLTLANNRDLRAAALNIEKVQALYRIQKVQQYPAVGFSAAADAYRYPRTLSGSENDKTIASIQVGFGTASWELDFFGRISSLRSAALERYLASEQARNAAQIALVAAVADSYYSLAAARENLKIAQATFETQQATYDLIKKTRDIGIASDLELSQAQSQVEASRVDIAGYTGQIALAENAISLLAGAPVAAGSLTAELGQVELLKEFSTGLPSDVLLSRPDILAAEHQLKAASANINAARAAYFPRISLTAAAGVTSNDLTNLFKPAAGTWNFAPQISLPIFDYGARDANYRAAQLDRDIAVAGYEKAIQSAFREVSDALSLRTTLASQQEALQSLLGSLEATYRLSEARYKGGIDSYLQVLIAQRALYQVQQQWVGLRLARLTNRVTLYKVLGGGS